METRSKDKIEELTKEPGKKVDELAHKVIGAAIEVHKALGPGYLESLYEEALAVELTLNHVDFERQKTLTVQYKNHLIGEHRLDFLVGRQLIVELKTVESIAPIHRAQVISYLKATGLNLGLLINFNGKKLSDGLERIVLS